MFGGFPFGGSQFGQAESPSGAAGTTISVPFIASVTTVYALTLEAVARGRLSQEAIEVLYAPSPNALLSQEAIEVLRRYDPAGVNAGLSHLAIEVLRQITVEELGLPFIESRTRVFGVFSLYIDRTYSGAGNGGESFGLLLAPNGASETPTLAGAISATTTLLELAGDGGLPVDGEYVLRIDDEIVLVAPIGSHQYRVRRRGASNTTAASHSAGATATWTDSYEMAIVSSSIIATSFTANIEGSGSSTYPGWLICFDSTQAFLGGDRYPFHVTEVVGVFDAGDGFLGTSRLDGPQPNARSTPATTSDDCPAALSNPARIASDIAVGDVAVVRYTNPEASILELASRSAALQSWFGIKRVDDTDNDVTLTDPDPPDAGGHGAHSVDTIPGTGPYTGSINGVWDDPLGPAIGPDTGTPTPADAPYTSVTLPGSDRFFTYGSPHYAEKGWPMCALAVRHGARRVPFWRSWDWKDFNYVYAGFFDDATYAQFVVNRNGIINGSVPEVDLPGPQDIDGPDAVWDDGSYRFAASWYVVIWAGPYLVIGPSIGGTPTESSPTDYIPTVVFPSSPSSPVISVPFEPPVEGGSGGGITPPIATTRERYDVALV